MMQTHDEIPANYGLLIAFIGAKIPELAHNHKDLFTTERESTITIASP
jgi:hypothetical protein